MPSLLCKCGHTRGVHMHYRPETYCGLCQDSNSPCLEFEHEGPWDRVRRFIQRFF